MLSKHGGALDQFHQGGAHDTNHREPAVHELDPGPQVQLRLISPREGLGFRV